MTHAEVSAYFTRLALAQIAHDPVHFLGLCLKRAALFWGRGRGVGQRDRAGRAPPEPRVALEHELPVRARARAARPLPACAGERAAARAAPSLWLTGLFVLAIFSTYALTGASERYRAPLIPFIFLFGAYALARLSEQVRARAWRPFATAVAAAVALYALASLPLVPYRAQPGRWHADRGIAYARAGERDRAAQEYHAALALEPDLSFIRAKLATLLAGEGRTREAIEQWRLAVEQRPQDAELQMQLTAFAHRRGASERGDRTPGAARTRAAGACGRALPARLRARPDR